MNNKNSSRILKSSDYFKIELLVFKLQHQSGQIPKQAKATFLAISEKDTCNIKYSVWMLDALKSFLYVNIESGVEISILYFIPKELLNSLNQQSYHNVFATRLFPVLISPKLTDNSVGIFLSNISHSFAKFTSIEQV